MMNEKEERSGTGAGAGTKERKKNLLHSGFSASSVLKKPSFFRARARVRARSLFSFVHHFFIPWVRGTDA